MGLATERYAGSLTSRVLTPPVGVTVNTRTESMPTYDYRCRDCGHEFEAQQAFTDDPLTVCPECGVASLRKKFGSVGIAFKGSGFYKTDSRGSGGASKSTTAAVPASGGSSGSSGTESSGGSSSGDASSSGSVSGGSGESASAPKKADSSGSGSSGSSSTGSSGSTGSGSKGSSGSGSSPSK